MIYSPIRQLSAEVIGQIAAGEVVEHGARRNNCKPFQSAPCDKNRAGGYGPIVSRGDACHNRRRGWPAPTSRRETRLPCG